MSIDILSDHPAKKDILLRLKNGKSPQEVAIYLQRTFPEHEYLHVDVKTLSKVAQQFFQEPKQKQWFSITVEGEAPVVAQFRVFAEDEDKAFEIIERAPNMAQMDGKPYIDLPRMRKRKVSIKNMLTGMIDWVRNF